MLRLFLICFICSFLAPKSLRSNPKSLERSGVCIGLRCGASLLVIVKRTGVCWFASRSIFWGRGMNKIALFSLVFWCLPSLSQTNSPLIPSGLLSLTPVQLRKLTSEPEKLVQTPATGSVASQAAVPPHKPEEMDIPELRNPAPLPDKMFLSSSERVQAFYRRLEEGGYLTRRELSSKNAFDRCMDAVFEPEVVHLRKIDVSCSLITAMKRRNPLC